MIFTSPVILHAKGIPVRMHWLLPVLLVYVLFDCVDLFEAGFTVLFLASLVAGLILHELGHSVVARRKGLQVVDILLTPIGGIARIGTGVLAPRDEIQVALAGPLVSGGLAVAGAVAAAVAWFAAGAAAGLYAAVILCLPNLALGVFNLLPAFPMDGGRVLRAALQPRKGRLEATRIAARMGQGLSAALFLVGLYGRHYSLVFIGVFIFLIAGRELLVARMTAWNDAVTPELGGEDEGVTVGPAPYEQPVKPPRRGWAADLAETLGFLRRDLLGF